MKKSNNLFVQICSVKIISQTDEKSRKKSEIFLDFLSVLGYNGDDNAVGGWCSLAARLVWDQEVAGSNPAPPRIVSSKE